MKDTNFKSMMPHERHSEFKSNFVSGYNETKEKLLLVGKYSDIVKKVNYEFELSEKSLSNYFYHNGRYAALLDFT